MSRKILFGLTCLVLAVFVLTPELFGSGKTKDYRLWYWVGQQVLHGGDLYHDHGRDFTFLYPPFAAILLAVPSYFGKVPLYIFLTALNSAAWWFAIQLSNQMAGGQRSPGFWVAVLPSVLTLPFVFNVFDIGQPNLVLLTMMLGGFYLIGQGREWLAGGLFAAAAAIKAFPVVVLAYLIARRQWKAAASVVIFLAVFLFLAPAPLRGFERNLTDMKTWFQGVVLSADQKGFGQRAEQNWSYKNQSIIPVTHRLMRPLNYEAEYQSLSPVYVNVLNLSYNQANGVVLGLAIAIGLGFLALMPSRRRRTQLSDAIELAVLISLMTIASPLARHYYFIWLLFPITVLVQRAAYDPVRTVRIGTGILIAVSVALMALSFPWAPHVFQALGNMFWATAVLTGGLMWHLRRSAAIAEPLHRNDLREWQIEPAVAAGRVVS